jgi:hypothetical protein
MAAKKKIGRNVYWYARVPAYLFAEITRAILYRMLCYNHRGSGANGDW